MNPRSNPPEDAKGTGFDSDHKLSKGVYINKLPTEILRGIFLLAQQPCIHGILVSTKQHPQTYPTTDALASTCSRWRHISLQTAELWSHIDIATTIRSSKSDRVRYRAQLWAKRACDLPLHLHFHEITLKYRGGFEYVSEIYAYKHVASVQLWSDSAYPFNYFPWRRLCNLFEPRPAQLSFSVVVEKKYIQQPNWLLSQEFCDAVNVLHFKGVDRAWDSRLYHNLTELRLENMQATIAIRAHELAGILIASPGLRSLALADLYVSPRYSGDPIPLNDLEVLNLRTLHQASIAFVLPLLGPGHNPLKMSIPGVGHCLGKAAEAFFERSSVTELFVDYIRPDEWCSLPPSLSKSLRKLAIINCSFLSEETPSLSDMGFSPSVPGEPIVFPELRELHLIRSTSSSKLLLPIIEAHSLEKLWLSECELDGIRRCPGDWEPIQQCNMKGLVSRIKEIVEFVMCADDHRLDPAVSWSFVT
ncbi:RNA-directed RNA polymerase VP1 [Ceratobasidium sp. AG-Ba]|nr:RNA-directed RNA polymerase VP1 [Ceratobasidium sp. AG-Ba]